MNMDPLGIEEKKNTNQKSKINEDRNKKIADCLQPKNKKDRFKNKKERQDRTRIKLNRKYEYWF